jgi:hypothetical protein
VSVSLNYSWQDEPEVLDADADQIAYPPEEISLPPTNRFNAAVNVYTNRFLGSLSLNYSDEAFWSDVLTSAFNGFTDSYAMLNGSFGVRFANGRVTTSIKCNNILNEEIQQHNFGDILKRSVFGEVRFKF